MKLRDHCPHGRLERDIDTGVITCKDCLSVVGYPRDDEVEEEEQLEYAEEEY
jgi:hypothetical protein